MNSEPLSNIVIIRILLHPIYSLVQIHRAAGHLDWAIDKELLTGGGRSNMYDSGTRSISDNMNLAELGNSNKQHQFRAIKEHLFSELSDEAVILSLKNGKYYGLNPVGVTVWSSIQEAATLAAIEAAVMSEYDVDVETCRREVELFLEKMMSEELVETIDEANS